jgi:hypothetical protein
VAATVGFAGDRQDALMFEDDQVRVLRLSLQPGEKRTIQDYEGMLLVHLTANLEGQMPPAEASWYGAGTATFENRAKRPFEGIVVGLRAPASGVPAGIPPEVAGQVRSYGGFVPYSPYDGTETRVRTLVDNSQVLVTLHRLSRSWLASEPEHFHPREVVLVYLAGGQISGSTGSVGVRQVRRGDFDVLPANLLHAFRNVGNDPIEFIMITAK